ncbi:MAG: alpha/beta hydrolase fold domain-containing protein [Microthrixaceae bacterium]
MGFPACGPVPARGSANGTILYLHGGGYIGTSPNMYAAFIGAMVGGTGCEVFVADYRLAPEFPFPAGLDDAVDVYECLVASG